MAVKRTRSAEAQGTPDWGSVALGRDAFIAKICSNGAQLYRDLPWRNTDDPYGVLVSEIMLQQTQVARVAKYWDRWMGLFPTVDALAAADTAVVLETWQGLGYNRRALALKRACETCASQYEGQLPRTADELMALPGIGPATAAGVMAFAYKQPAVYIETNVRSVFLHELFPDCQDVSDKQLAPYVADTCPSVPAGVQHADVAPVSGRELERAIASNPRSWYYALLDYGAHLKTQVANPSRRSAHHARQSKFEGSRREKRSFVLKQVLSAPEGIAYAEAFALLDAFEREAGRAPVDAGFFDVLVAELVAEGFFSCEDGMLKA